MYTNFKMEIYNKTSLLVTVTCYQDGTISVDNDIPSIFHPFRFPSSSQYELDLFLKSRIFDESRPDKKEILSSFGLDNFNAFDIAKITHGILLQDEIWLKFDKEPFSWKDAYEILRT